MKRIVVLLDIDGTLVDVIQAGKIAFARAFEAVHGVPGDFQRISFAGTTDLAVYRMVLEHMGARPEPAQTTRFFTRMAAELEQSLKTIQCVVFPGVHDLLAALDRDPVFLPGLLTGNIEICARMKLAASGLRSVYPFGAYGDEHEDRLELARLARARGLALVGDGGADFVVLGDTPADVACAREIGGRCLAVATGRYHRVEDLEKLGADLVLPDLGDTERVMRFLRGT